MTTDVTLRPAGPDDVEYVETVLARNGLPASDPLGALDRLYVCETGTERIGVGGFERCGDAALLRSVAIEASASGEGYGTALCNELLGRARSAGVTAVYLLTTTAEAFFARLGFERIDREAAPEPIRDTDEFGYLCPSTAVCMRRDCRSTAVAQAVTEAPE